MSTTIIVPAPTRNLTSLATLKRMLNIVDDSKDEELAMVIAASSDYVCNYCGREFAMQTVREELKSAGTPELLLSLTPIINIDQVAYDDVSVDGWTLYDADAGIIQDVPNFRSTMLRSTTWDDHPSSYGRKRWSVTYTGGYVLPDWGESQGDRTLPFDLERAVLDLCRATYAQSQLDPSVLDPNMSKYKIGDTEITWGGRSKQTGGSGNRDNSGGLLPPTSKAVLDYYRRAW